MKKSFLVLAATLALGLAACNKPAAPSGPSVPTEEGKVTFYFEMADNEAAKAIPEYCSVYLIGAYCGKEAWPTAATDPDVVTLQQLEEGSKIWYGQWEGSLENVDDKGFQLTVGYKVGSGAPSIGVNWSYKSIECQAAGGDSGLGNPVFTVSADGKTADLGSHHWEEVPPAVVLAENVTLQITLEHAVPAWTTLYAPGNYKNNWACNSSDAMTPNADRTVWTMNIPVAAVNTYEMKIIAEYTQDTRDDGNSWGWGNVILSAADGSANFSLAILRSNANSTIDLNERAEEGEIHADFDFETNFPDPTKISKGNFKIVLGAALDTTVNPKWYVIGSFTGWKPVELSINEAKTELTASFPKLIWDTEAQFGICVNSDWNIAVKAYNETSEEFGNLSYTVPHVEHNVTVEVSAEEVVKMNTAVDTTAWVNVIGVLTMTPSNAN